MYMNSMKEMCPADEVLEMNMNRKVDDTVGGGIIKPSPRIQGVNDPELKQELMAIQGLLS